MLNPVQKPRQRRHHKTLERPNRPSPRQQKRNHRRAQVVDVGEISPLHFPAFRRRSHVRRLTPAASQGRTPSFFGRPRFGPLFFPVETRNSSLTPTAFAPVPCSAPPRSSDENELLSEGRQSLNARTTARRASTSARSRARAASTRAACRSSPPIASLASRGNPLACDCPNFGPCRSSCALNRSPTVPNFPWLPLFCVRLSASNSPPWQVSRETIHLHMTALGIGFQPNFCLPPRRRFRSRPSPRGGPNAFPLAKWEGGRPACPHVSPSRHS